MVDQSCVALSPELTIEDIRNSEESIQFYTGLQNYESFKALYLDASILNRYSRSLTSNPNRRRIRTIKNSSTNRSFAFGPLVSFTRLHL
jgi:hypothetical protein